MNIYVVLIAAACISALLYFPPYYTPKGYRAWKKLKADWAVEKSKRIKSGACLRCGGLVEQRHPSTKLNLTQVGLQHYCDRCINWIRR